MNTFQTVVMVCAMLAAACSGQYTSQSAGSQGSSGFSGMLGGQYAGQGQQPVLNTGTLPLEQQGPASSPTFEQSRPAMSAPAMSAPAMSAPAATQQICSCITIHPAGSASVASSATSSASESVAPMAVHAQQSFAAAPQQTLAAAQQQAYAAPHTAPAPAQSHRRY